MIDRPELESEFEMARRHVLEGRAAVQRQEDLIADLKATGRPLGNAEGILNVLTKLQLENKQRMTEASLKGVAASRRLYFPIRPVRVPR